jgi:ribonuclease HII
MLSPYYTDNQKEAGCDEAGRGCLAGPVFAAAVILPGDFYLEGLNDSKKLSAKQRDRLRDVILDKSLSFAVAYLDAAEIDEKNILASSIEAMHRALDKLSIAPALILVDGNRFTPYKNISHKTIVGGDGLYASIAAASILAKTYRDDYMLSLHEEYPMYGWDKNKGYPTETHIRAIETFGQSPYHRKTFHVKRQYRLFEGPAGY